MMPKMRNMSQMMNSLCDDIYCKLIIYNQNLVRWELVLKLDNYKDCDQVSMGLWSALCLFRRMKSFFDLPVSITTRKDGIWRSCWFNWSKTLNFANPASMKTLLSSKYSEKKTVTSDVRFLKLNKLHSFTIILNNLRRSSNFCGTGQLGICFLKK